MVHITKGLIVAAATLSPIFAAAFRYHDVRRLDLALRMIDELEARSPMPPDRPEKKKPPRPYPSPQQHIKNQAKKAELESKAKALGIPLEQLLKAMKEEKKLNQEVGKMRAELNSQMVIDQRKDDLHNAQNYRMPQRR